MSKLKTTAQNSKLKTVFLGTADFVQPIKDELAKHFTLTNSLDDSDLGVVAAYGKILTRQELNTPKYGFLNVHPSLLPKYRGPSPIQATILNGDKVSGITIIKIDEKVDHGPIIYQEQMGLSDDDNFDTLSKKMFLRAKEILPKIIEDFIKAKIKSKPQNHQKATFCKLLKKEDGYFDIDNPPDPEKLDRIIRAYYPWPNAWTKWSFGSSSTSLTAGAQDKKEKIVKFYPNGKIQMEGKKVMPLKEFLNGYPDFPLKTL